MGRKSSERIKGDGPGGPSVAGNWGVGASYNYGDEQIVDLMAGSSGSSGRFFQGSKQRVVPSGVEGSKEI